MLVDDWNYDLLENPVRPQIDVLPSSSSNFIPTLQVFLKVCPKISQKKPVDTTLEILQPYDTGFTLSSLYHESLHVNWS